MGKFKRRGQGYSTSSSRNDANDDNFDDDNDDFDPNDETLYNDDIDNFHDRADKILLDKSSDWKKKINDESDEEEAFPLHLSDSDDESFNQKFEEPADVDMESDLEEGEEDGLPDAKAWGKKKSAFYATDYIDDDYGELEGSDIEAAEHEEIEALSLQQKLLAEMDEADFDLDYFKLPQKETKEGNEKLDEKIGKDFSALSKKEKRELMKKESPELIELIKDFKEKMSEAANKLQKIISLIKQGKIPKGPGAEYIQTRYHIILNYCINILFYMTLKARHTPVQQHPVIKRLVNYRNLLKQLESLDEIIKPQVDLILQQLDMQGTYEPIIIKKRVKESTQNRIHPVKKTVKFKTCLSNSHSDDNLTGGDVEPETVETDTLEKRKINYQIAKNKGLTPHRKKEQRNPRVKHRMKYRKANIRRKGQVREHRTEVARYGGEISGIKANISKSIKFF